MSEQSFKPIEFTHGVMAVLGRHGQPMGTAFLASSEERLLATCAHVLLQAGWSPAIPENPIQIRYHAISGQGRFVQTVVEREWFDYKQDIAFLRVQDEIPNQVRALPLLHAAGTRGHETYSFGYPEGNAEGLGGEGRVVHVNLQHAPPRLQMNSTDMTHGYSGGPVWDEELQRVIGMVLGGRQGDEMERLKYVTFAAPTESLLAVCDRLTVRRLSSETEQLSTAGGTEVRGDQYNIGKVSGGAVAIGRGARANQGNTPQGLSQAEMSRLFEPLLQKVAQQARDGRQQEAVDKAQLLKAEVGKEEDADDSIIAGLVQDIAELVPDAAGDLVTLFTKSAVANAAGGTTKFVIARLRG